MSGCLEAGRGPDGLTPRQRQVLAAYGRLSGTKAVAHALGIAPRTVARHAAAARGRLDVESLIQAVVLLAEAVATPPAPDGAIAGGPQGDPYPDGERRATMAAMATTGPDLRTARLRAGLSQTELARRLGLARQRVTAVEAALRVTPALAARYIAALGEPEPGGPDIARPGVVDGLASVDNLADRSRPGSHAWRASLGRAIDARPTPIAAVLHT